MVKAIVIVESPTKVKTINKILGPKFKVTSSMGHLIDLPRSTLGVDIENNFEPKFIVVRSKQKILTKLKKDSEKAKEIYVATDPDREGEAIGFNLINHIGKGKKIYRVTFQEITKTAVLKAFEHPREFDSKKIEAQTTRRVLDRIVGYKISPILWRKVGSRLSAGRVQSVALRIIVEREKEIEVYVPKEYWKIKVDLKKQEYEDILPAILEKIDNEKFELCSEQDTLNIVEEIKSQEFNVSQVSEKEINRKASPPFKTSTMQQDAFNKLRFNASKTMRTAQQLYEGIDLGDGQTEGLITYMRTDSVNVSNEAIDSVRGFIKENYGEKYLPETPNKYKSKKSAQEAHEAIRPANVNFRPEDIRKFLDSDQYKLYELIWNRFVSSQMVPAVYIAKKIEIIAGRFQLGASGSTLAFDGFLAVNADVKVDGEEDDDKDQDVKVDFSHYAQDDKLSLIDTNPTQHFTKPPPRFSDASLVKALEEDGIGRPSTYASIILTLVLRNYVVRDRGYFKPTELGTLICDLLIEYFPKIMDVGFTALMEEHLDLIEEGNLHYADLLQEFYKPFKEELDYADQNIVKQENFIDKECPECGCKMAIKWGRRGKFLSCSGFPKCKFAEPFTSGVKCPQENCGGDLIKRKSKKGMHFYGCSKYPECTYVANELPSGDSD
ncbi:MAG: type I DNA topoisomerase [Candidatus Zapsychrus exili]|nr:type I DNA topoisomerase [Candidatus Zapsychrus exili]